MARSLKDLNDGERRALLNHIWNNMVSTEIAAPVGITQQLESPLGKTGGVPHDLAEHIQPFVGGARTAALDWSILNGSCPQKEESMRTVGANTLAAVTKDRGGR